MEIISAVIAGSVGMWLAITLIKAIDRSLTIRKFVILSIVLTILLIARELLDLINDVGSGSDTDKINGAIRIVIAPAVGCIVGWLLSRPRSTDPAAANPGGSD